MSSKASSSQASSSKASSTAASSSAASSSAASSSKAASSQAASSMGGSKAAGSTAASSMGGSKAAGSKAATSAAASGPGGPGGPYAGGDKTIPGNIRTEPIKTIAYNAPCCFEQKSCIRVTNEGSNAVFWKVTPGNKERYGLDPENGMLKAGANVVLDMKVRPFFFKADECLDEILTFEWVDAPAGHAGDAVFNATVFARAYCVLRHIMTVRYNA